MSESGFRKYPLTIFQWKIYNNDNHLFDLSWGFYISKNYELPNMHSIFESVISTPMATLQKSGNENLIDRTPGISL